MLVFGATGAILARTLPIPVSTFPIMHHTGSSLIHECMSYRKDSHWRSLVGSDLAFARQDSDNPKAPESLTGCGRESPKGFFECVTALTFEVRPAIISKFQLLNFCYIDHPLDHGISQNTQELGVCRFHATLSGLTVAWRRLLFCSWSRIRSGNNREHE